MESGKSKEELWEECIRLQKDIAEGMETQECRIRRFQLPAGDDGLLLHLIDHLPYPMAIFRRNGALCLANRRLMKEAGMKAEEISAGRINLLDRVTDENYAVFEAAEDVFLGETTVVRPLSSPLALFCRDDAFRDRDPYQCAVFFPAAGNHGEILCGAVVLMK